MVKINLYQTHFMINGYQKKINSKLAKVLNPDIEGVNTNFYYIQSKRDKLFKCYLKNKAPRYILKWAIIEKNIQP